MVIRNLLGKIY